MFTPGPSGSFPMQSSMQLLQKAATLVGSHVGISLKNGQGVSGKLCSVQGGEVYVLQYLYASQFATFHYPFSQINDIFPFPAC